MPVVEDLCQSTAFVLGFLHSFHLQIPKDGTQAVYKRVALAALKKLELASLTTRDTPQDEKKVNNTDSKNTLDLEYVTHEAILGFVSTLIKLKLSNTYVQGGFTMDVGVHFIAGLRMVCYILFCT